MLTRHFAFFIFLFASFVGVSAQVLDVPLNFVAPPPETTSLSKPFEKTVRISGREYKITSTGWMRLGSPGTRLDGDAICLEATAERKSVQIRQDLHFDPPLKLPMFISCRCKADIAEMKNDCAFYLDFLHDDDTPLWAQAVHYEKGCYDFRDSEHVFIPAKPIKKVQVYLLLRNAEGTAVFDRLYFGPVPVRTPRLQAVGGLFGGGTAAAFVRPLHPAWDQDVSVAFHEPDGTTLASRRQPERCLPLLLSGGERSECLVTGTVSRDGDSAIATRRLDTEACDAGRGYALWTTTSMERIFPYSLPRIESDDVTDTPSAKRTAREMPELRKRLESPRAELEPARNEDESFQIALLSPKPLKGVRIEFTDLVSESDASVKIDAKHLDWKQVGFVVTDKIRRHPKDTEGLPGWWPDPLLPVDRFDVPAGQTQPVWVTLHAPKETKPGRYRGAVTVKPENAPATKIPLSVTVWDFELPEEGNCRTAFALMDGFLEKTYGVESTTPELRKRYGDFLLRHRLAPEGDISRTTPPVLEELKYYRNRGLGVFNIQNMVESRGKAAWRCNSPTSVYTPEFKARMLEILKPYVEELRKRGLSKQAYVYTFDERSEEYSEIMTEFFGMIKEHFPEVATFTTSYFTPEVELMNKLNIDWICPLTPKYDFEQAERCRAAGKQVWSYICCAPDYPYANIMCRFPLIESRLIFWQAYRERFDGLLYWGVNIWGRRSNTPIDPMKGPFLDWRIDLDFGGPVYGDGHLIYAGTEGRPIGSIRLANLRDGLEDYEYLHAVEKKTGSSETSLKCCTPVSSSLRDFSRNPSVLYRQRDLLIKKLLSSPDQNR